MKKALPETVLYILVKKVFKQLLQWNLYKQMLDLTIYWNFKKTIGEAMYIIHLMHHH